MAAGGLHLFQLRLHERYGPVAAFRLPRTHVVSVADAELLAATTRVNSRPEALYEFLGPLFESGNLQTMPADEHIPWRRLMLSVLGNRRSHEEHFAAFTQLTLDLADRWEQHPDVLLQLDLAELSLRMIADFALSSEIDSTATAQRLTTSFKILLDEYVGRDHSPPSSLSEEQRRSRAEQALAYVREVVTRILDARGGAATLDSAGTDLVSKLAGADWTPARIRDTVLVVMLAAHHTSGVTASWTLHLLAEHEEVADRVRQELDRVLGDRPAPTYAELSQLDYLEQVIKEAMRCYPANPYASRGELTEDLVLGDYLVPAGTTLLYPIWALHMSPRYWPDPERFDPGRFTAEAAQGRPKFAFVPFGFGPRSCEGAVLAMIEVKLMLAVLLKRFELRPVPGHPVVPVERLVLWSEDDIRMTATPRSRKGA